jgi:hypothetical protein
MSKMVAAGQTATRPKNMAEHAERSGVKEDRRGMGVCGVV